MQAEVLTQLARTLRKEGLAGCGGRLRPLLSEALQLYVATDMLADVPLALIELAFNSAPSGQAADGVVLFAAVDVFRTKTGLAFSHRCDEEIASVLECVRAEYGSATFDRAWKQGHQMDIRQAAEFAISICKSKC